ncbi:SusC/RagA family TonB-linked outer membrane protein [Chitinophaga silvatica]|nr:SusC/RagA family TonB-linked outer membrane protein [Chitinophaga silvatica]
MKLTTLFTLSLLIQVHASTYGQMITLKEKNTPFEKVIKKIREQTGIDFFGNARLIENANPVTIDVKQANITEVLKLCFANQQLDYTIADNTVIVKEKKTEEAAPLFKVISGTVRDVKGNPLPGVNIKIKGKQTGTISNNDGTFKLNVDEGDILIFSFIGFKPKEIAIRSGVPANVVLENTEEAIKDVVVTGYFDRDKKSFSGASRTITRAEIQKYSSANIFAIIQNIDAGFKVQQDNNFGSDPNRIPEMTIRGRGSFLNESIAPVFIVDGFEMSIQKVFDLDVNRIESITLLKDASATILYGSRAANGVVVLETRAPAAGKLRVTYDLKPTMAIADLSDYHLMNASQKLEFEKFAGLYTAKDADLNTRIKNQRALDAKYNDRYREITRGVNTDWLSQPTQNALSAAHSLFVEGGTNELRFGIDMNYNNAKGVMKQSGRDRYGLGFNLNYRIKDKITIRNYASYSGVKATESPFGAFSQYTVLNPYETPFDTLGRYRPFLSDNIVNPLYNAYLPYRNWTKTQTFSDQLNLDWFVNNDFRIGGSFKIQKDNINSELFNSPRSSIYQTIKAVGERGQLALSNGEAIDMTGNIKVSYKKKIDKHTILSAIAAEMAQSQTSSYSYQITGFPDDRFSDPSFAIQFKKDTKPVSDEGKTRSVGVLGNLNYMYDDRYFADFSFRTDGSSRFGANNRIAPFYSVGAGWNINKESFWKTNKVLNELRIRGSYGVTGNQEFSAYQARTTYQFLTDRLYYNTVSATLLGYGNENLQWQKQYMTNIGTDMVWLNSRIRMSAEYYIRKTDGLLTDITVAPSLGFPTNSYKENLGEIQNTGYEFNLNAIIFKQTNNRPEWAVSLMGASNKSKLLKISNALKQTNKDNNAQLYIPKNVYEEGESMTAIKAVQSLGIDPASGKEVYLTKDRQITYAWNANDKITSGNTEPTLFGNIATNLAFKGWNLNMTFQYRYGGQIYNQTLVDRVEGANPTQNADIRVLEERWKAVNDWSFYKNIAERTQPYISSRFVQNENTLTLTNLSLSYDFSRALIRKIGLERARCSFYMNDVLRFSTVKLERGLTYPFARSFVFGLNVSF